MSDSRIKRLMEKLDETLDQNEKRLFKLIQVESRKGSIVFRMPKDVFSLEEVWQKTEKICVDNKINYSRQGLYATLDELDDVLGDIKWIWRNWIPRGFVTMLVGDPGVGKSIVSLDFVKNITNSRVFPGEENNPKAGNIIWIDTEASQQLLRVRSIKMGVNRNRIYIPVIDGDILGQTNVMDEHHQEHILAMLNGLKPELLILDSLGGSHNRGENKVEEIAPIMKFFAMLARDYDVGVLMTHHLNKGVATESPEVSIYRIRGSTAIPQYARSIIAVEHGKKEDETKLRVIKSNLARRVEPLSVVSVLDNEGDVTELQYDQYKPPPRKRSKQDICAEWVINVLSKEGEEGLRLKRILEMAESFGYTRGNLYSAKMLLQDKITVTGTGKEAYWHLSVEQKADVESINSVINSRRKAK